MTIQVRSIRKNCFIAICLLLGCVLLAQSAFAQSRLRNISTRSEVLTGNKIAIAGFIIEGNQEKCVVVRGRGPSVNVPVGVQRLANPKLVLKDGNVTVKSNNDWQTQDVPADVNAIQDAGAAPGNSLDAAIYACLDPGPYTALLSGDGGGTGVGIVEVLDVSAFDTTSTASDLCISEDMLDGTWEIDIFQAAENGPYADLMMHLQALPFGANGAWTEIPDDDIIIINWHFDALFLSPGTYNFTCIVDSSVLPSTGEAKVQYHIDDDPIISLVGECTLKLCDGPVIQAETSKAKNQGMLESLAGGDGGVLPEGLAKYLIRSANEQTEATQQTK